ncbi:MAG: hypothetical protein PHU12_00990 [Candidatus Aenigmarchaeota archaeon]|nr:hypothetical protein [Candidatus Aenigmarchaeota archaeon]
MTEDADSYYSTIKNRVEKEIRDHGSTDISKLHNETGIGIVALLNVLDNLYANGQIQKEKTPLEKMENRMKGEAQNNILRYLSKKGKATTDEIYEISARYVDSLSIAEILTKLEDSEKIKQGRKYWRRL